MCSIQYTVDYLGNLASRVLHMAMHTGIYIIFICIYTSINITDRHILLSWTNVTFKVKI